MILVLSVKSNKTTGWSMAGSSLVGDKSGETDDSVLLDCVHSARFGINISLFICESKCAWPFIGQDRRRLQFEKNYVFWTCTPVHLPCRLRTCSSWALLQVR